MKPLLLTALLVSTSTSSIPSPLAERCTPHACILYREAAIRWRTNAEKARLELGYCSEQRTEIAKEHERALSEFIRDASAPPGNQISTFLALAIAGAIGVAGFTAGALLGIHMR